MKPKISVVVRTLNEEKYLDELLSLIHKQDLGGYDSEVVLVDSGSSDSTIQIAELHGCKIIKIKKSEFTFGRSLNIGCQAATGKYLVFVSGHCLPKGTGWLTDLVRPLDSDCEYTYGRQLGKYTTKFSERRIFAKYFPEKSQIPQNGFFCNNANAALRRDVWERYRFDEELTGCEDMHLAKRIVADGGSVGYVAEAGVYHIHDETWRQIRVRYEREALALKSILRDVRVSFMDAVWYALCGIALDWFVALKMGALSELYPSLRFRIAQFYGAYVGSNFDREISDKLKRSYFYPLKSDQGISDEL